MGTELDRNRPFGTVGTRKGGLLKNRGHGHSYYQDGKTFDTEGDECAPDSVNKNISLKLINPYGHHLVIPDQKHRDIIDKYKKCLEDGDEFPMIWVAAQRVMLDGYELVDGYKRWHAYKELGVEKIWCEVLSGELKKV